MTTKDLIQMATLTTTEIAAELDTTPRTLRKFLRADAKATGATTPGKGSRYSIEKKEMRSLRSKFAKWTAAQESDKADNAPADDETA
jgi:predicted transcriptional regulator